MNCASALEIMLDAELPDLAGQGMTPVAAHVATCTRCRTVALRLHADTGLLATFIAGPEARVPRRAPAWVRWTPVPVALTAALLLMQTSRTPDVPPNVSVSGASSKLAVIVPDVVVPPRAATNAAPVVVQPTRLRAYPAPIPVAAVRINPPQQKIAFPGPDVGPAVIVDPPAGQRVAVMRTSNPKLTVVWLY